MYVIIIKFIINIFEYEMSAIFYHLYAKITPDIIVTSIELQLPLCIKNAF